MDLMPYKRGGRASTWSVAGKLWAGETVTAWRVVYFVGNSRARIINGMGTAFLSVSHPWQRARTVLGPRLRHPDIQHLYCLRICPHFRCFLCVFCVVKTSTRPGRVSRLWRPARACPGQIQDSVPLDLMTLAESPGGRRLRSHHDKPEGALSRTVRCRAILPQETPWSHPLRCRIDICAGDAPRDAEAPGSCSGAIIPLTACICLRRGYR